MSTSNRIPPRVDRQRRSKPGSSVQFHSFIFLDSTISSKTIQNHLDESASSQVRRLVWLCDILVFAAESRETVVWAIGDFTSGKPLRINWWWAVGVTLRSPCMHANIDQVSPTCCEVSDCPSGSTSFALKFLSRSVYRTIYDTPSWGG